VRTQEIPNKQGVKARVKPKLSGSSSSKEPRSFDLGFIQQLHGLSRWTAIVPIVVLLIFLCSELALAFGNSPVKVDTRSRIITDYSPWDFTIIRALDDGITDEIENDMVRYGDGSEVPLARLSDPIKAPGEFKIMIMETPVPTPSLTEVVETPPTLDPKVTVSITPTESESGTETVTPTSTQHSYIAETETATTSPVSITETVTPTKTATSTITLTSTVTASVTATFTPTIATRTVTPTVTSSSTPKPPPPLCFEEGGWYALHYHTPNGSQNHVSAEFHEGHGMPDGPMLLNSVIIESVNLRQEGVADVERIEKVQVGWRNGTMQDIPWSGEASPNVTIPIGIEMPYVYPAIDHAYRATYVTFYLGGDIDGSYYLTLTIFIPEYSRRCSITADYSTN